MIAVVGAARVPPGAEYWVAAASTAALISKSLIGISRATGEPPAIGTDGSFQSLLAKVGLEI